jgi:salicylate hydroxylase
MKIGIIGAGPAGIASGLALEYYCKEFIGQNLEITIIDKNKSSFDYPGVEYGIQERACLALRRIGLKDQALASGLPNDNITFYNTKNNQLKKRVVNTNPDLTVTVSRQAFLADLTGLLKHTVVKRELDVTSISTTKEKVTVTCNNSSGAIETYDFDMLIAADGIGSIVRKDYFKHQDYIHPRGFSCLYMLIDVPENARQEIKDTANNGDSSLVLGNSTTATFFALGKNRIAVGIGFDDSFKKEVWESVGATQDQSWKELDVTKKQKIAEILADDCSFKGKILKESFQWVPDWNAYKIYLWGMRDSDVAETPYNEFGNVIMIGDAAHAIMPTIGMGASLAIEDAEILGKYISGYLKNKNSSLKDTLASYSKNRVPVWRELMSRSRNAAKLNFIDIKNKKRLSFGPQIQVKFLWRIIAKIEEFLN